MRAAWGYLLASVVAIAGCRQSTSREQVHTGDDPVSPPPPPTMRDASIIDFDAGIIEVQFTKEALLGELAVCAQDKVRTFDALASELSTKIDAYAADRTAENRTAAQNAWREAIATWEELEMMQFGPAAKTNVPGGRGFRDQIYAFPLFSRCKVEEQLVSQMYQRPELSTSLVSGRGLAAIEYLLFHEGTDNACSQFSRINADGTWAALGAEELAGRKAEYAAAAADIVESNARDLSNAWDGFRTELETAGRGSALFATDQDALNAISDALFYLDKEVKDQKLARPLGLSECNGVLCPQAFESLFARASTDHLRRNMLGYRRVIIGCGDEAEALGFDDWLRAAGAGELANRAVITALESLAVIDELDRPVEDLLETDTPKVRAVYDTIKAANDILKTELVTVLNLELPMVVEGDND